MEKLLNQQALFFGELFNGYSTVVNPGEVDNRDQLPDTIILWVTLSISEFNTTI
jgi:hypothetical protein